jgi:hypothetical protein
LDAPVFLPNNFRRRQRNSAANWQSFTIERKFFFGESVKKSKRLMRGSKGVFDGVQKEYRG